VPRCVHSCHYSALISRRRLTPSP